MARLLLADAKPEKILCLTFTKAAAAEMQDRLFRQLGEWSMLPDDELRDDIVAIGGDAHDDLPKARRLFAEALETPGGLKVLTLHAFCQIVLSRFPIEAGVPPGFEVLDDQSARELIAEARQRVLERAGAGDARLATPWRMLVTETSEATLAEILDAALGGDRRKLDRFFDGLAKDLDDAVLARRMALERRRRTHSVARISAPLWRGRSNTLRAVRDWLSGGGKTRYRGGGERWRQFLARDFAPDSFAALGDLLAHQRGRAAQEAGHQDAGGCASRPAGLSDRSAGRASAPAEIAGAPPAPPRWPKRR